MATTITLPRRDLAIAVPTAGGLQASGDWYRWARDITSRVGGVTGASTATIEATANEALSAASLKRDPVPTKDLRQGDGITVSQDAAGNTVAVNQGHIVDLSRTFDRREPVKTVRQGDGITVSLDALGYSVSLDTGFLVNAVRAYAPRPSSPPPVDIDQLINAVRAFLPRPTPQMAPDDAQAVLANRVFSH